MKTQNECDGELVLGWQLANIRFVPLFSNSLQSRHPSRNKLSLHFLARHLTNPEPLYIFSLSLLSKKFLLSRSAFRNLLQMLRSESKKHLNNVRRSEETLQSHKGCSILPQRIQTLGTPIRTKPEETLQPHKESSILPQRTQTLEIPIRTKPDLILPKYTLPIFTEDCSAAMSADSVYLRPTGKMIPFPDLSGHPDEALMGLITFSLHYMGCYPCEIWLVLDSYGFKHDVDFVSSYINRYHLVDHHYRQHGPKHDKVRYAVRSGPVDVDIFIDYIQPELPEAVTVWCTILEAREPQRKVYVRGSWGDKVETYVRKGRLVCQFSPEN